jgi:hypothetical protein
MFFTRPRSPLALVTIYITDATTLGCKKESAGYEFPSLLGRISYIHKCSLSFLLLPRADPSILDLSPGSSGLLQITISP